ncbi:MFS transporter [Nostoc sphaeroides CHAB 2801]|uniref:MFS transporter n=1 Tax=Nostoc sphaeroides TaxID=446679 RepID=UPI001E445CCE|nr:MFS transporter [Nostoc sphaeroides]MCC5633713.1 MFS transporter [Nostoc sphaeroides CHAB 2801]
MEQRTAQSMGVFIVVWLGQLLSLLGSGLTSFVLGIWVYQQTGSITQFALISMFAHLPSILLFPLAGVLVDRWNRRWVMLVCDTGSGLTMLVIAYLVVNEHLAVWHIYGAVAINSIFNSCHWPAYTAAATLLLPKKYLSRGTGMMQLGDASRLVAPLLGGVLLDTIQLRGVILVDFITFAIAFVTLVLVRFPQVKAVPPSTKRAVLQEAVYGWTYIRERVGLLALVLFMASANFLLGVVEILATPMALSFTSPATLGTIFSIGSIGILAGSLLVSHWSIRIKLVYGVLASQVFTGLSVLMVGFHPTVITLTIAIFVSSCSLATTNGCSQLILRKKVAIKVQGRVFAFSRTLSDVTIPLAFGVAGFLADQIFEPLMANNGLLAPTLGKVIGVGTGQGIRLLIMIVGCLTVFISIYAWQYPRLTSVEKELPDTIDLKDSEDSEEHTDKKILQ